MSTLRRLLCAILGHQQPAIIGPASWWRGQAFYPGPCRRCGEDLCWPVRR